MVPDISPQKCACCLHMRQQCIQNEDISLNQRRLTQSLTAVGLEQALFVGYVDVDVSAVVCGALADEYIKVF